MENGFIITNENDIYVYFELIRQLNPKTILDAGMFLKRIGAVARAARGCELHPQIRLTGVDAFPAYDFPIYHRIYDRILPLHAVTTSSVGHDTTDSYDLAVLFHVNEYLSASEKNALWDYCAHHCACIIGDTTDPAFTNFCLAHGTCQVVSLEGQQYAIVSPDRHSLKEH